MFKSTTLAAATITFGTDSYFHHVGVIVKDHADPNEVYWLEAQMDGVQIAKWSVIKEQYGPGRLFDKVAYRKVKCHREDAIIDQVHEFVHEVLGNEYNFDFSQILFKAETDQVDLPEGQLVEKKRKFICSELVYKFFKIMGVVKNDKTASANFTPGHFSNKHDEMFRKHLTPEAKIEPEELIIVNREDIT